jgi:molybdate transport system ATP-binding protein
MGGGADEMTLTVTVRKRLSPAFELDVSLIAEPGVTMLFGRSGSGKTTVLRLVAGLLRPDGGRIAVGDRLLFDSDRSVNEPVRQRRIGYVFQQLALFPHLTVAGNIEYGLAHLGAGARRERSRDIADSFHIGHLLARRPDAVSGGERQRTALARALVTNPDVLLLDEPLSALDYVTQARIMDDLRRWNEVRRIPVLYVTHAHREVFSLGDRVVVLDGGRISAEGTPYDVMEMPGSEPLAQMVGFENFFSGIIIARRPDAATMTCRLEGTSIDLEVPAAPPAAGPMVRIGLRAGDILLATEEPRGLSARNVLRGHITSLRREGPTVVADVTVSHSSTFRVHLTPGARDSLQLSVDLPVWLVVKTHSCRIMREVSPS